MNNFTLKGGKTINTFFTLEGAVKNMISNEHRQKLSAWFIGKKNYSPFFSRLKLQKFLFLYEMFSKTEFGTADFSSLKAYRNGPVFSDVFGDFTYRREEFIPMLSTISYDDEVNEDLAEYANFIVSILNEEELSDLTHELDMWKVHEEHLNLGLKHLTMSEGDISNDDYDIIANLRAMYSHLNIQSLEVITINKTNFVLEKRLKASLTQEQQNALVEIADHLENNPVFVHLNEEGVLEID